MIRIFSISPTEIPGDAILGFPACEAHCAPNGRTQGSWASNSLQVSPLPFLTGTVTCSLAPFRVGKQVSAALKPQKHSTGLSIRTRKPSPELLSPSQPRSLLTSHWPDRVTWPLPDQSLMRGARFCSLTQTNQVPSGCAWTGPALLEAQDWVGKGLMAQHAGSC
jgi:hypothetical protein